MDDETRTKESWKQDADNAARVVRHIAVIERDYGYAMDTLSLRLMNDAFVLIGNTVPEPWITAEDDYSISLMLPEWKMTRGIGGRGDAWLQIAEIGEDDAVHSWIGAAVKAGKTSVGLALMFRPGLEPVAKAALADNKNIAPLTKLGFQRDEAGEQIYIPIAIATEALAMGFEENDLTKALLPLKKVVETVVGGKAALDTFIELVRLAAKAK